MRFLICDIKRIFSNKKSVLLYLVSPVLVVLIFAATVIPMLTTSESASYNLALCNNDDSEPIEFFINQTLMARELKNMINTYPVATKVIGEKIVKENKVSLFINIPENMYYDILVGKDVEIDVMYNESHALEAYIVAMTLRSTLSTLGQSLNVFDVTRLMLEEKGISTGETYDFLWDSIEFAILKYMNRQAVLGNEGMLASWGSYLPIEFYLGALFSLFGALAMLPLIHFSNIDNKSAILNRGLLTGNSSWKFFLARWCSGAIFIFIVISMIFPTALIINFSGNFMGSKFDGNIMGLIIAMITSAMVYSALAIVLGTLFSKENISLWFGFFLILVMGVICGIFIPNVNLPLSMQIVGKYLPLSSSMRALSAGFFAYDSTLFWPDILKLIIFTILMLPIGLLGMNKRRNAI